MAIAACMSSYVFDFGHPSLWVRAGKITNPGLARLYAQKLTPPETVRASSDHFVLFSAEEIKIMSISPELYSMVNRNYSFHIIDVIFAVKHDDLPVSVVGYEGCGDEGLLLKDVILPARWRTRYEITRTHHTA